MTTKTSRLKRFATSVLVVIASVLMWCEETLWVWLKQVTARLANLAGVQRLEALILQLPPYAMMIVFLLPMSILLPFKVLAVYWITRGYWFASAMTIIAAKVVGTAIVARMYVVCHPKLMTIAWFKWIHDRLIDTRDHLYAALNALPFYRLAREKVIAIKQAVKQFLATAKIRQRIRIGWRSMRRWYERHRLRRPY